MPPPVKTRVGHSFPSLYAGIFRLIGRVQWFTTEFKLKQRGQRKSTATRKLSSISFLLFHMCSYIIVSPFALQVLWAEWEEVYKRWPNQEFVRCQKKKEMLETLFTQSIFSSI
jgi:hypothetical protein